MPKKLAVEEKVNYMRIALALCNIGVNDAAAEVMVKVYEGIKFKGGSFSVQDAAEIEAEVKEKYERKEETVT